MSDHVTEPDDSALVVRAAVIIRSGRLLVASRTAAPGVIHLPGGKPAPGEDLETARPSCANCGRNSASEPSPRWSGSR